MRPLIIAGLALVTTSCGLGKEPPAQDLPPWKFSKDASGVEVRILVKEPYTYLYALDGRLREIRYDSDKNQKPDVFAFFSGRDTPDRLEIDDNRDGRIDRWEEYNPQGLLVKYATASRGSSPDRFVDVDPITKTITQVETDADHDGRRERRETFSGGKLTQSEVDTNADGRLDRLQTWQNGILIAEEVDRDGDGKPDIRLHRSKTGSVTRVEHLQK